MCIRLIGMRLLFCCGNHDIQYGELIVANKSGITVEFTVTNSISWVSTCWIHFEVWQICDLSLLDYDYIILATCQLCERLKTMSSCHPCHPCHHTTHEQPCHHGAHDITPPMRNHAIHAACCIIVFCCWFGFASVLFYQNWVSAA